MLDHILRMALGYEWCTMKYFEKRGKVDSLLGAPSVSSISVIFIQLKQRYWMKTFIRSEMNKFIIYCWPSCIPLVIWLFFFAYLQRWPQLILNFVLFNFFLLYFLLNHWFRVCFFLLALVGLIFLLGLFALHLCRENIFFFDKFVLSLTFFRLLFF